MANCSIIREGNEILFTEAPNGQRSTLFDALVSKFDTKQEALQIWLTSKTVKFLSNIANPRFTKHRLELIDKLNRLELKKSNLTLNIQGKATEVNLDKIKFTSKKTKEGTTLFAMVNGSQNKLQDSPVNIELVNRKLEEDIDNLGELKSIINEYFIEVDNERYGEGQYFPKTKLSQTTGNVKADELLQHLANNFYYGIKKKPLKMQVTSAKLKAEVDSVLKLMFAERAAKIKLAKFEELITDVLGKDITLIEVNQDTFVKLMDPSATLESLNAEISEEYDSLLAEDGSLNYGTGQMLQLNEPSVNLANFERFVELHPEAKPVFEDWYALLQAEMKAGEVVDKKIGMLPGNFFMNDFIAAAKALGNNSIEVTISKQSSSTPSRSSDVISAVVEAYNNPAIEKPTLIKQIDKLFGTKSSNQVIQLGRLRYKENRGYIQVESSLLSPLTQYSKGTLTDIKGLGIGSKMYAELLKLGIKTNRKVVSSSNLTQDSMGVWEKLVNIGIASKVGDRYELNMNPKGFDRNGEPNVDTLLNFVDKQGVAGTLTEQEILDLKEVMLGLNVESSAALAKLLHKGFFTNENFSPTRNSLAKTKLYTSEEITDILSNEELQNNIREYIYKLDALGVDVLNDIYVDEAYLVVKDGTKDSIGRFKLNNPYLFEKVVIEKLGGIKTRQEFEDALFEDEDLSSVVEPYLDRINTREDIFYKTASFQEVAVVYDNNGKLEASRTSTREKLENTLKTPEDNTLKRNLGLLVDVSDRVYEESQEDVNNVIGAVLEDSAKIGIDLSDFKRLQPGKSVVEIKELFAAIHDVLEDEGEATFSNLVSVYDDFFNIKPGYKTKKVKLDSKTTAKNTVFFDSNVNKATIFKNHNLIPVGRNVFKRVDVSKSVEELYEFIYNTTVANGYNNILPDAAVKPTAFDEDGTININKLRNPENKESIIADMQRFVANSTRQVFSDATELTPEELEKYVILFNYYNRTANLTKFDDKPNIEIEQAIYNEEISNQEYLTASFPEDFNAKILVEKLKNTEAYKNIYSNFEVDGTGIHLVNSDPITVNRIKTFLNSKEGAPKVAQDLKNYFKLHRQGLLFENVTPSIVADDIFLRNYYSNFPTALKPFMGDYKNLTSRNIQANSKDRFIRIRKGVYEAVEAIGTTTIYSRLGIVEGAHKDYNKELAAPIMDVDLDRIKPNLAESIAPIVSNLYNQEEGFDIANKFDNC